MSNAALEKEGINFFRKKNTLKQKYFEQMVQKNHKVNEAFL
jgi:hypothetical protein